MDYPEASGRTCLSETELFGAKPCANCGTPGSTLQCTGCKVSDVGDIRVFYCGIECQKTHWPDHKTTCNARRRLGRAVSMFHEIWMAFEAATFWEINELKSIDHRTNQLQLGTCSYQGLMARAYTGKRVFAKFPDEVVPQGTSETVKRALLAGNGSSEPFTTGFPLLKLFLVGESMKIKVTRTVTLKAI